LIEGLAAGFHHLPVDRRGNVGAMAIPAAESVHELVMGGLEDFQHLSFKSNWVRSSSPAAEYMNLQTETIACHRLRLFDTHHAFCDIQAPPADYRTTGALNDYHFGRPMLPEE